MPKVRAGTPAKWVRRASSAGEEYTQGVQNPRADWAEQTTAAKSSYNAGVQAAIQRDAFAKGVKKAGSEKWQQKSLSKGPQRFSSGVADAGDAYAQAIAPYLQTIESTNLPPRRPKGDPANIARVAAMAKALRDKKISLANQG